MISVITLIQIIFNPSSFNRWKVKPIEVKRYITIVGGIIIGALVGITSIGLGSLFALFILFTYKFQYSGLVGADITHAFLLTTISGILMAGFGHIDYSLVGNLLCVSIPGAIIGSKLTKKIPSKHIRIFIVIVILISEINLFFNIGSLTPNNAGTQTKCFLNFNLR